MPVLDAIVAPAARFVFQLPLWYVASRSDAGTNRVATGRVGESLCLLLFTDAEQARRCVRDNAVPRPRIGRLITPTDVYDFLLTQLPPGVTHIAFDAGTIGQAAPAVVSYQSLLAKMRTRAWA